MAKRRSASPGRFFGAGTDAPPGQPQEHPGDQVAVLGPVSLPRRLKVKNRLAGRLPKVQADIQAGLVEALVSLKAAINEANREVQRNVSLLAENRAAQFLAGLNALHGPQPAVWPVFLPSS
jgi:hypothetical protein